MGLRALPLTGLRALPLTGMRALPLTVLRALQLTRHLTITSSGPLLLMLLGVKVRTIVAALMTKLRRRTRCERN
jgi:hypothetical protein